MLANQKHLFDLQNDVIYLNGAYMSPQLKSCEEIGIQNLKRKSNPSFITERDFFSGKEVLKERFAQFIDAPDAQTVAIIPSVSYGIATALKNIPFQKGDEIVVLEEQFPSNYYAWKALEKEEQIVITTITAPPIALGRAEAWNTKILNAISPKTKVVALPQVHWADGTLFDLKTVRQRAHDVGAYLIIDGTQSVGAYPFSIAEIQPDALICGGYKWLLGPYSLGMAYYGERFHQGTPIENNWMSHVGSENFSQLIHYNENFKPKAARYDVGESSNFILTPMLAESIRQLTQWTPVGVQKYCEAITKEGVVQLQEKGCFIEAPHQRAHHLFGIYLPEHLEMEIIKQRLLDKNIFVSYRGNAIRVSPNVYNSAAEMNELVSCFIY